MFASHNYGVMPDVITCAKGLGAGLPIGVCIVNEKLKDIFKPGMNGSTFGGNPMVCAGAVEVLNRIGSEAFLNDVVEKGEYYKLKLEEMEKVEFVRGKGLMIGVKLKNAEAHDVLVKCAENGLLVLTAKDLIRFLPPLTIEKAEIDAGLKIFEKVLNEVG